MGLVFSAEERERERRGREDKREGDRGREGGRDRTGGEGDREREKTITRYTGQGFI